MSNIKPIKDIVETVKVPRHLLEETIQHIGNTEVILDCEFGDGSVLKDLIKNHQMPDIYYKLKELYDE